MNDVRLDWLRLLTPAREYAENGEPEDSGESPLYSDYLRVICSASFRRLQDKTQVFPLDRSDFVRTRLTHSLEVSALARALARKTCQELYFRRLAPELSAARVTEICEILRVAGLIHDIGNPPFGHYGETTIRDWFRAKLPTLRLGERSAEDLLTEAQKKDFLFFEGNAQGLRVLSKLHYVADQPGMNLCFAVLSSTVKYPCFSPEVDPRSANPLRRKIGCFQADRDLFEAIGRASGCGTERRNPLALLLEAADDIAYRTADIEDAQRKGHISFSQFVEALQGTERLAVYPQSTRQRYAQLVRHLKELRDRARQAKRSRPDQDALQNWTASLRQELLSDAASHFADAYEAIMEGHYRGRLGEGRLTALVLDVLGDIAYAFVFSSRAIVQMEISANTMIGGLLDKFVPAAMVWGTDLVRTSLEPRLMAIISDNYKASYTHFSVGKSEAEKLYLRLLLITDYISGMTDSFAMDLFRKMHGQAAD